MQEPNGVGRAETQLITHRQKETLDSLEKGEIESIRVSKKLPVDQIVAYGLRKDFSSKDLIKKISIPEKLLFMGKL